MLGRIIRDEIRKIADGYMDKDGIVKLPKYEINKIVNAVVKRYEKGEWETISKKPINIYVRSCVYNILRRSCEFNGGVIPMLKNPSKRRDKKYKKLIGKDKYMLFKMILDRNSLLRERKSIKRSLWRIKNKWSRLYSLKDMHGNTTVFYSFSSAMRAVESELCDVEYDREVGSLKEYNFNVVWKFKKIWFGEERDCEISLRAIRVDFRENNTPVDVEKLKECEGRLVDADRRLDEFTKATYHERARLAREYGTVNYMMSDLIERVFVGGKYYYMGEELVENKDYFTVDNMNNFVNRNRKRYE